jgi:arginine exporter protein ArgO
MGASVARIFDVFVALVAVAGTMVVVTSPQTAKIITAWGGAFSESTRAATGRG